MFCPQCRYEYRPDITRCTTCDVDLVDILPQEDLGTEDVIDWIQIARLNSQQYAEMFLEILQKKEIPAVIRSGTGYFGITGQLGTSSYAPTGGGYSLYVGSDFLLEVNEEGLAFFGEEWEKLKLIDIDKNG